MAIIMDGHVLHVEEEAQHLAAHVEIARLRMEREKVLDYLGQEVDREMALAESAITDGVRQLHLYGAGVLRIVLLHILRGEHFNEG